MDGCTRGILKKNLLLVTVKASLKSGSVCVYRVSLNKYWVWVVKVTLSTDFCFIFLLSLTHSLSCVCVCRTNSQLDMKNGKNVTHSHNALSPSLLVLYFRYTRERRGNFVNKKERRRPSNMQFKDI